VPGAGKRLLSSSSTSTQSFCAPLVVGVKALVPEVDKLPSILVAAPVHGSNHQPMARAKPLSDDAVFGSA
jgi:hypothetical protein